MNFCYIRQGLGRMAYSHCTGQGPKQVQETGWELGSKILYRNVHTALTLRYESDQLSSIMQILFHVVVPVPCSVNDQEVVHRTKLQPVADPGFPRNRQSRRGPPILWPIFPGNFTKMKKFWLRGHSGQPNKHYLKHHYLLKIQYFLLFTDFCKGKVRGELFQAVIYIKKKGKICFCVSSACRDGLDVKITFESGLALCEFTQSPSQLSFSFCNQFLRTATNHLQLLITDLVCSTREGNVSGFCPSVDREGPPWTWPDHPADHGLEAHPTPLHSGPDSLCSSPIPRTMDFTHSEGPGQKEQEGPVWKDDLGMGPWSVLSRNVIGRVSVAV